MFGYYLSATGTVAASVVRENGTGLLRIEYQIDADLDSGDVDFLTAFDFSGYTPDIDFIPDPSQTGPSSANRNINTATVSLPSPRRLADARTGSTSGAP